MPAIVQSMPGGDITRKLSKLLNNDLNHDIEEDVMEVWDKGVFLNELKRQRIVLSTRKDGAIDGGVVADEGLKKGTYKGTRMAMTETYSLAEEAAVAHFDAKGFEHIFPRERDLTQKQDVYQWSNGTDGYPPHLQTLPPDQQQGPNGVGMIFDLGELQTVTAIANVFQFIIPQSLSSEGTPFLGPTIADCEQYNRENPSPNTDIMEGKNLGDLPDWYSDARFAQQHLSGVNPSTITAAPSEMVETYVDEASKQKLEGMQKLLAEGKDLFVQDYSYFREATGLSNDETFQNIVDDKTGNQALRYACASVAVFQLHSDGRLHPLAITLDHRGSLDRSITIFNQRLTPDDKGDIDEKEDWPWRYAKTCVQTADWARHEVATHLVDTHMIEEAIIVATNRTIPDEHLLYEILSPHWFRTLALNAAARAVLVPAVIARLSGLGPTAMNNPATFDPKTNRCFRFVDYSFKNFNFQDKYIPNDLKKRGFDLEGETGDKYRNYPYATDMYLLWGLIRQFVAKVLGTKYTCDSDVRADSRIADWCKEIQGNGQIPSFPTIKTVDQLVDAVTMCIHTASPQHTAVNYLQDYYYSFVPAKPPALCTPLPKDLKTLQSYTEKDLTAALPIGTEGPRWKDWLLAAQLPELLSFKVEARYNLMTYAKSLYNVNKDRSTAENKTFHAKTIKTAAARFYSQLKDAEKIFERVSDQQTEGTVEYKVLQPELTAVSILI